MATPIVDMALLPQSPEPSVKTSIAQNKDCIQANIPTLGPCSPVSPSDSNRTTPCWSESETMKEDEDHEEEKEVKTDEILSCLNGVCMMTQQPSSNVDDDERVVDLWHLRQLAISNHGLVNASIRKRVWPKLVGANEHILTASFASLPSHFSRPEANDGIKISKVNDIAEEDIFMIKSDIDNCNWNIEEEIKSIRKQRDQERQQKQNSVFNFKRNIDGDASVASLDSGCSSITAGRITPQLIPECVRAFPRFGSGVVSPHASGTTTPVSGIATPNTLPSIAPIGVQNMSINENSIVPTIITKVRKSRRKRKEEQALLLNIITTVLRAVPDDDEDSDESDFENDDDTVVADNINKLYYFKGMHNVIGPLLITLESPSLTSLIFNRLAQNHFRDAMGSTFENIQAGIRLVFMPLLEKVDKTLYDYIIRGGVNDPCKFALPWVLCWFTNDITNYDIVSRLFDVFIASHPSFPVYLSVAMLTHYANKRLIMMCPCDESRLVSVISSLPSTTADDGNALNTFEEIIDLAVSYM